MRLRALFLAYGWTEDYDDGESVSFSRADVLDPCEVTIYVEDLLSDEVVATILKMMVAPDREIHVKFRSDGMICSYDWRDIVETTYSAEYGVAAIELAEKLFEKMHRRKI